MLAGLAVVCAGAGCTSIMYGYHGNSPPELRAYLVRAADLPGVWAANSTIPSYGSETGYQSDWYLVVEGKNQNARGMFWGTVRCWVSGYGFGIDVPITGLQCNATSWQISVISLKDSVIRAPNPNSVKVEWEEIYAAAL